MKMLGVAADTVAPQAWRNGGGQTRELLAWPDAGDWQLRISRADIAADGPFSAFPGVERWFTVLGGGGVVLSFADGERELRPADSPLQFDGAAAPGCRLLDGPTQDLNLMLRRGAGGMWTAQPGQPWDAGYRMRGLYTTAAGSWTGGGHTQVVPAHHLLWSRDAAAGHWTFDPLSGDYHAAGRAWWLGFTPFEE